MNNLSQSLKVNQANSKAKVERKTRQESYRSKFGSRPHMIIPQEDSEFIEQQSSSVIKLWHQCWRADPYGSHPIQLNHTLSNSSFKRAKKIISDAGLFVFEAKKSKLDNRQTVCWMVQNLHGARRNDYWLKSEAQIEGHQRDLEGHQRDLEGHQKDLEAHQRASILSQSHTQHGLQNPSETSQERLSNSSKELLKTLPEKKEIDLVSSGDRSSPFEGAIATAEQPMEKKEENLSVLPTQDEVSTQTEKRNPPEDLQALNKKSTEVLNQDYKFDWRSTDASERASAQILAIEAQKDTPEYQTSSKEAFALIRAKFEEQKQKRLSDRTKRLQGDKPDWLT